MLSKDNIVHWNYETPGRLSICDHISNDMMRYIVCMYIWYDKPADHIWSQKCAYALVCSEFHPPGSNVPSVKCEGICQRVQKCNSWPLNRKRAKALFEQKVICGEQLHPTLYARSEWNHVSKSTVNLSFVNASPRSWHGNVVRGFGFSAPQTRCQSAQNSLRYGLELQSECGGRNWELSKPRV